MPWGDTKWRQWVPQVDTSWQSLITQIWHTARWDWVKYVDNKYKNVGTESHNCFLFYGRKNENNNSKIRLEGKSLLPWTSERLGSSSAYSNYSNNQICSQWCIGFFNSTIFLPESSKTNHRFHATANSFQCLSECILLSTETCKQTHRQPQMIEGLHFILVLVPWENKSSIFKIYLQETHLLNEWN